MKKRNKFISAVAIACMMGQVPTYAAIPTGTVVINNKAFDINEQKNVDRTKELLKLLKDVDNELYVNTIKGLVTEYTNKKISSKRLPVIEYKDKNGSIRYYDAKNGEELKFGVDKATFTSNNSVQINFTTPGTKEELLNRDNYKIGGNKLSNNDRIELSDDGKSVAITLTKAIEEKEFETSIEVLDTIKDINGKKLSNKFKEDIVVIQGNFSKNVEGKSLAVIGKGFTLQSSKIDGNLYIQGEDVKIKGCEVKGQTLINCKSDAPVKIEYCTMGTVIVNNVAKELELEGNTIEHLKVQSEKKAKIKMEANTNIKLATISTESELINKNSSIDNVLVDFVVEEHNKTLKLHGEFEKVSAVFDCKILSEKESKVSVVVDTETKNEQIKLQGYFDKVNIKSKAEIKLEDSTRINIIESSVKMDIPTGKNVEVGEVKGNVTIEGNGEVTGGNPGTSAGSTGGGFVGGGGGGSSKPSIKETSQDKIIESLLALYKDLKTFKVYDGYINVGKYDYKNNILELKVNDKYKDTTAKDIYNTAKATENFKEKIKLDKDKLLQAKVKINGKDLLLWKQVRVKIDGENLGLYDISEKIFGTRKLDEILNIGEKEIKEKIKACYKENKNKNIEIHIYEEENINTGDHTPIVILKKLEVITSKGNKTIYDDNKLKVSYTEALNHFGIERGQEKNAPISKLKGTSYKIVTNEETVTIKIK